MEIRELPLDGGLSPSLVWSAVDPETRRAAALALYRDKAGRAEGDAAIATALRFREVAVRKLPVEQRVGHLLRSVRIDDSLASSLLIALHLEDRKPLLTAFLDDLGIPHDGGLIDPAHDMQPPDENAVTAAVERLDREFDAAWVELYLVALLAMDADTWGALAPVLSRRR